MTSIPHLHRFKSNIKGYNKPSLFTFPFCYAPHPLSIAAAKELQDYLDIQTDFDHNFGLIETEYDGAIGKMFGVLVVEDLNGELGYLAAVSGKLANTNNHPHFVPPVFDILDKEAFFLHEEAVINAFNKELSKLETDPLLHELQLQLNVTLEKSQLELRTLRTEHKKNKADRQAIRSQTVQEDANRHENILQDLIKQSYRDQHEYAVAKAFWAKEINSISHLINDKKSIIKSLKKERKERSAALQNKIFDSYSFLNADGEIKNLREIFEFTVQKTPPAGAGECSAPKLLQYAYINQLKPICMAEFWWGAAPPSEVRRHGAYYPSCRGKCEPILSHMLIGLDVDTNPLIQQPVPDFTTPIIYEDNDILVVNKPIEILSVPGKTIHHSVYSYILSIRPEITGPVIVHRLDMSTSGILILAKNKEAHRNLQQQFATKQAKKRYTALLDGILESTTGTIDLPLRVDLEDRPRQVVCYEYGKKAITYYKVIEHKDGMTRIHFFPVTGRTHQLRVHAAHHKGLGMPIVGDDLYGKRSERLYLHAGQLSLIHPRTGEKLDLYVEDPF